MAAEVIAAVTVAAAEGTGNQLTVKLVSSVKMKDGELDALA